MQFYSILFYSNVQRFYKKRYTLGLLSATNPKAKAHKAQALHRVQQKHTLGFKKVYLNMPELVRGKTGNCRAWS
jgi:hypothetical protein